MKNKKNMTTSRRLVVLGLFAFALALLGVSDAQAQMFSGRCRPVCPPVVVPCVPPPPAVVVTSPVVVVERPVVVETPVVVPRPLVVVERPVIVEQPVIIEEPVFLPTPHDPTEIALERIGRMVEDSYRESLYR